MTTITEQLREKVVLAHRILGVRGLFRVNLGHASVRVPGTEKMLLRCRGGHEYGMKYTTSDQIKEMDFDGNCPDLEGYRLVTELPLHGEIYRSRPDVGAVVHAHPTASTLCTLAELELRPILGAYEPDVTRLVLSGVPKYKRSVTVDSTELAATMLAVMGKSDALLMDAHGVVVTGKTIEDATVRAIKLEHLAEIHLELAKAGVSPKDISEEDIAHFTARGQALSFDGESQWRYYVKELEREGLGVDVVEVGR
jgi:ribulose-5-phosphate 4-epimerase/fuculose-1-phosphate aldolase